MLRDWRRAEGIEGQGAFGADFLQSHASDAQSRATHRQSPQKSLSICFLFLPFPSAISGLIKELGRERAKILFFVFSLSPYSARCPRIGGGRDRSTGTAQGRPHMLWLEGFEAIAFPGADLIISILCGAISRRPLFPPVLILRPFAVRQRASKDAPRRLASPSRRPASRAPHMVRACQTTSETDPLATRRIDPFGDSRAPRSSARSSRLPRRSTGPTAWIVLLAECNRCGHHRGLLDRGQKYKHSINSIVCT